jgi:hypothetical protein
VIATDDLLQRKIDGNSGLRIVLCCDLLLGSTNRNKAPHSHNIEEREQESKGISVTVYQVTREISAVSTGYQVTTNEDRLGRLEM